MNNINNIAAQEFQQVHGIISLHRSRALQTVNNENLLTAWEVGAYVSERLKDSAWGSKTVMQLSEYLRSQDPTLRGYSRRSIYKMVAFYETYSSVQFIEYQHKLKLNEFVPPETAQIEDVKIFQSATEQTEKLEIVPPMAAQFPNFLNLTTLTNHYEILNTCNTIEERIFYVLYAHRERLNKREMLRCLKNNTFASLTGDKHNFSKGLKDIYPQAAPMLKDAVFVDFLGLPQKHSEKRLQNSILDNMKDFVLELGKDFLFVDKEYSLQVGSSTFKVENPSIGILLCQEADRSVVEYARSRSLSPTMIAEYKRQLIPKEVLQHSLEEFTGFLNTEKILE
ncbi:hypothetical protein FACS1894123_01360 [Bacteroidia bacterium]|nr:hypothetical protein FACS1894123_01360 [Bacteroidia bacterium]